MSRMGTFTIAFWILENIIRIYRIKEKLEMAETPIEIILKYMREEGIRKLREQ